ncbi:hypothetical protein H9L39_13622, partial [Fusarium oxysporum f. sp. albedinis]
QSKIKPPEQYFLPPTEYCPNSKMPVLVYRNVLPSPRTIDSAQTWIEKNGWLRAVTILSGSSDVLMGVGKFDDTDGVSSESERHDKPGLLLTLREGDVVIHPAGTGHSNVRDEGDYRYLSFFPEGSPRWISENGERRLDQAPELLELIAQVPMPQDLVTGNEGYLVPLWRAASE